ncbi:MAG: PfkB family carbohydrate kinase [Alphaproteobacteria bacterium]
MCKQASVGYAVVIGAANMDLYGQSQNPLISEESNIGTLKISAGGVGRNIAENLALLGTKTIFLSAVGDDIWGQELLRQTQQSGVDTSYCLKLNGKKTSSYLSIHQPDGEMAVALNDMSIVQQIDADYLKTHHGLIIDANIVIIDANLSGDALAYLFSLNLPFTMADPVSLAKAQRLKPYLSQIQLLKPNRTEAKYLADVHQSLGDIKAVSQKLHDIGVKYSFISCGVDGAVTNDGKNIDYLPVINKQNNNVTGAGDATLAALAHGMMQQWPWQKICHFAMVAASMTAAVDTTINQNINEKIILEQMEKYND